MEHFILAINNNDGLIKTIIITIEKVANYI